MLGLAKRVKAKILQASTSEVYGDPSVHPQREDYWGNVNPIGPRSCYDEGKRCAETLFFDYRRQHNLPIKVARIFNTYGPPMHPNGRWQKVPVRPPAGSRRSPRCGARTRSGRPCMSPAVSGKRRCRMHGGAFGSGAPPGNKNALKHGLYTGSALKQRQQLRDLLRQSRELIRKVKLTVV